MPGNAGLPGHGGVFSQGSASGHSGLCGKHAVFPHGHIMGNMNQIIGFTPA